MIDLGGCPGCLPWGGYVVPGRIDLKSVQKCVCGRQWTWEIVTPKKGPIYGGRINWIEVVPTSEGTPISG